MGSKHNRNGAFKVAVKVTSLRTKKTEPGYILKSGFISKEAAQEAMPKLTKEKGLPSESIGVFFMDELIS